MIHLTRQIMSPSAPLREKKMNLFAFESGGKWSLGLDTSHIDRTSQESILRDTSDREKIRSSRTESISSEAQSIASQNYFHYSHPFNRECITIRWILQNTVRMRHSLLIFIKHAFLERVNSCVFPSWRCRVPNIFTESDKIKSNFISKNVILRSLWSSANNS